MVGRSTRSLGITMVDVAIFILMVVMAFRISRAVSREAAIFEEFRQSRSVGAAVLLYPVAPILVLVGTWIVGSIGALILAAGCLVPGLIISRKRMRAFERSGTDRTKGALAASTQAFGTALAGLLYLGVVAMFVAIHLTR